MDYYSPIKDYVIEKIFNGMENICGILSKNKAKLFCTFRICTFIIHTEKCMTLYTHTHTHITHTHTHTHTKGKEK